MSLDKSIAGKYKVGNVGRVRIEPSHIVGCIYLLYSDYVMLLSIDGQQATVRNKQGEIQQINIDMLKAIEV